MVSHTVRFFNALLDGAPLDPLSHMAYISVVPKPHKDPGEVGNYCPISLIDNDLFTNVLGNGLSYFIPQYVHKDQVALYSWQAGSGPDQEGH